MSDHSNNHKITAIRAARLIDGTGKPGIENAVVLIKDNVIETVGNQRAVPLPPSAEVIDLGDETILPGLIDAHVHLTLRPDTRMLEGQLEGLTHPDGRQMLRAARNARVQLLSGVTTAYIMGEVHFNDVFFAEAARNALIPSPRIYPCGNFVTTTAGHGPAEYRHTDGPAEMVKFVRWNLENGANHIKLTITSIERAGPSTGWLYAPGEANFTVEEVAAAVQEAHRHRRLVTAHASGDAIKVALRGGVDTIQHGYDLDDEIIGMLKIGATPVVNTYTIKYQGYFRQSDWKFLDTGARCVKDWIDRARSIMTQVRREDPESEQAVQKRFDELRNARNNGIPISVGTDSMQGLISLEIQILVEAGFSPLQAICAATGVAAKAIGLDHSLGTLEPGKLADVISVRGNPESSIRAIEDVHFIMIGGKRCDTLSFH